MKALMFWILVFEGTEEMYWSVSQFAADAGIEITASHNPIEYNGMKIVKSSSEALTEREFLKIKSLAENNDFLPSIKSGRVLNRQKEAKAAYLKKILSFVDLNNLRPIKIVINSGNGVAGPIIDEITVILKKRNVEFEFFLLNHHPNSSFPNGIPNPILKENQSETSDIVVEEKADFGVAFDGDFDRCFLFDHFGNFVSGEYVVGLLAQVFLENNRKEKIVYDPRVIWNTLDVINKYGGDAVVSKTGHAFMKRTMREVNAIYGGEMSAHHYFRDFVIVTVG